MGQRERPTGCVGVWKSTMEDTELAAALCSVVDGHLGSCRHRIPTASSIIKSFLQNTLWRGVSLFNRLSKEKRVQRES